MSLSLTHPPFLTLCVCVIADYVVHVDVVQMSVQPVVFMVLHRRGLAVYRSAVAFHTKPAERRGERSRVEQSGAVGPSVGLGFHTPQSTVVKQSLQGQTPLGCAKLCFSSL